MISISTAPDVAAIRAELRRINEALSDRATSDEQCIQLYAARSAMDWMLNHCVTSPYDQAMRDNAGDQARQREAQIRRIAEEIAGRGKPARDV